MQKMKCENCIWYVQRWETGEATRSMYKAPKDEREAIKIEFLGFSRGEPEDTEGTPPNFSELKEKPKLN